MRPPLHHLSLSACVLAVGLLVSACGGGGASAPPVQTPSSGFAVDGYLRGATTLCDRNGNGLAEAGEARVTTDASGFFEFDDVCPATLVVTGGTNIDTGLPFVGQLKAPAGSTMVTPLTTLMVAGMTMDQINAALGLPAGTNITTLDPARSINGRLQNPDLFRKTLAMQQLLQKTAETLAGLAPTGNANALYAEAAAAMAAALRTRAVLVTGGVVDQAALQALLSAAATRTQASIGLGINAASLAQVMAGGLKLQMDRILQASDATLTATTRTEQGSAAIATFVAANQPTLAVAPGAATEALATQLVQNLSGGVILPPPPPPAAGTLIVSFDEASLPNLGAFGDAAPSIATAPAGGTGAALKLDRSGSQNFGGTFFSAASAIPFAANRKTVTARVYATRANAVVYLKVELPGGTGGVEVAATTGAANTWQTLTWALDGVNPASSYSTVVFSADTNVALNGAQTYWIDEVTLADASAVTPPPVSVGTVLASFDETTPPGVTEFGGAGYAIEAGPSGATGNVLRITRNAGEVYAGAWIAINPIPNSAGPQTVSARVYSPTAGIPMVAKAEYGDNLGTGDVQASQTVVVGWQTLTWTFTNLTSPNVYNRFTILPNLGTVDTAKDYYFDDIALVAGGSSGGGGTTTVPLVFSTGFAGSDRTVEGGGVGGFSGSNRDGFSCSFDPAVCGVDGGYAPPLAAADSYFLNYYQTTVPATALYSGVFIQAPGVTALNNAGDSSGVAITNQTRLKITVGQNPEWFNSSTNNFLISMDLGRYYVLGSGNGCRLQVRAVVTPTAAEATYLVPLSAFELVQNCGGVVSSAAQAFAQSPVSQINVQANGGTIALPASGRLSGANLTVANGVGAYATTVVVKGGIGFE